MTQEEELNIINLVYYNTKLGKISWKFASSADCYHAYYKNFRFYIDLEDMENKVLSRIYFTIEHNNRSILHEYGHKKDNLVIYEALLPLARLIKLQDDWKSKDSVGKLINILSK